jgi:hypothetical protein
MVGPIADPVSSHGSRLPVSMRGELLSPGQESRGSSSGQGTWPSALGQRAGVCSGNDAGGPGLPDMRLKAITSAVRARSISPIASTSSAQAISFATLLHRNGDKPISTPVVDVAALSDPPCLPVESTLNASEPS